MTNRRLIKEVTRLLREQSLCELLDNDYIIHVDESNTNLVHALIKSPKDSVYRHKFIRLDLKIPENYPYSPPEVTFINHDEVRIHPNMYENGKCCSTILNTWGDNVLEKWTSSMGIETILLTFHSFLDNNPYTYEPGGHDDVSYTIYVLHQSWHTCLIRYLQYEKIQSFIEFIHNYMLTNVESIFTDLSVLKNAYPYGNYYTRCFEIDYYTINYEQITSTLQYLYNYLDYTEKNIEDIDFNEFLARDKIYTCNICFDTETYYQNIQLECHHKFHTLCLRSHIDANADLCPMCRQKLSESDKRTLDNSVINVNETTQEWIINPVTKRKVKVGSRTYHNLVEQGVIIVKND